MKALARTGRRSSNVDDPEGVFLRTERENALRTALQEIINQGLPFANRGGRVYLDWAELQRRVHQAVEKKP